LPDLFKEGKGVVAQGQLVNGVFEAKEVLAKHDENYMPPEAAEALKNAAASNEKTSSSLVQGK
jgi:cytochrome c-type biogenesis protein CcmE